MKKHIDKIKIFSIISLIMIPVWILLFAVSNPILDFIIHATLYVTILNLVWRKTEDKFKKTIIKITVNRNKDISCL